MDVSLLLWLVAGVAGVVLVYGGLLLIARFGGRKAAPLRDRSLDAVLALALGKREQAEALLSRAVDDDPDTAWSFMLYGAALMSRGDHARAARMFEGLLARHDLGAPLRERCVELVVDALVRCARLQDAARWAPLLDTRLALDRDALARRCQLAIAARAPVQAEALAGRLEKIDRAAGRRMLALAHAARAEDMVDADQIDEGRKLLKKALARDSELPMVWALEGELNRQGARLDRAREAFAQAFRGQDRLLPLVAPLLEDAHIEHEQVAEFEGFLQELVAGEARSFWALRALALHHARRRHFDQALRIAREALELPTEACWAKQLSQVIETDHPEQALVKLGADRCFEAACKNCGARPVEALVRCPHCGVAGEIELVAVATEGQTA